MSNRIEREFFENWDEYQFFLVNLRNDRNWQHLNNYDFGQIHLGFVKHYFRNLANNEIWELLEPDPPFRGGWKKI